MLHCCTATLNHCIIITLNSVFVSDLLIDRWAGFDDGVRDFLAPGKAFFVPSVEVTLHVSPVPFRVFLDPLLGLSSVILKRFGRHPALAQRAVLAPLIGVEYLAVFPDESLPVLAF